MPDKIHIVQIIFEIAETGDNKQGFNYQNINYEMIILITILYN